MATAERSWYDINEEFPETVVYSNDEGSKAILTFRDKTVYGTVELVDRKEDYRIESVGDGNVIWALLDPAVDEAEMEVPLEKQNYADNEDRSMSALISEGERDTTTVVEYSVTIYYTQVHAGCCLLCIIYFLFQCIRNSRCPRQIQEHLSTS